MIEFDMYGGISPFDQK